MILVLDAHRRPERADGEARHVAGGEDVLVPGYASVLVDDDSVGDLQPGGFGELGVRDHAQSGDDRVRLEREAGLVSTRLPEADATSSSVRTSTPFSR